MRICRGHTKKCPKVLPNKKTASSIRQPSLTMKTEGHHRSTSHLTRPLHSQSLCSELHGRSATSPHSSPSTMLQLIQSNIVHIPRHMNDEADKLAKVASRKEQLPPDVLFEEITEPSVKPKKEKQVSVISAEDWRTPIMEYLRENIELPNERERRRKCSRERGAISSPSESCSSQASPVHG